jgi:hypothetical protein
MKIPFIRIIGVILFTSIWWGVTLFPATIHAIFMVMGGIMIAVVED